MSMRFVLVMTALGSSLLSACSDDGVPSTGDASASGSGDGADATDPTSALDTGGPNSASASASASASGTGDDSNADSTGVGTTTGGSSSETGVDTTGTGEGSSSTTDAPATTCTAAADCVVWEDCCSCVPLLDGAEPPACDVKACKATACEAIGFEPQVQCELESCEFVPVPCGIEGIACDDDPPDCNPGTLPSVDPEQSCWTGLCVPAEACDVVPSCADCPADEVCVEFIAHVPHTECVPLAPDCDGQASCGCMDEVCVSPFDSCSEQDGGLACTCIAC